MICSIATMMSTAGSALDDVHRTIGERSSGDGGGLTNMNEQPGMKPESTATAATATTTRARRLPRPTIAPPPDVSAISSAH